MHDEAPSTPLTDKALARLRALATGNGLDPEKLVLTAGEEKIFLLEGTTTLTPIYEATETTYSGPPRGKGVKILPDLEALRNEIKKRASDFRGRPDWIEAVRTELRKEPGEGWGLDGARVELPSRTVTLATSVLCPTCKGRKNLPCTKCYGRGHETCFHCQGQRQEFCYFCNYNGSGTGQNPPEPGQICVLCSGHRYIPCRTCHASGQTICPMCHARGATPCTACKGVGQTTTEARIVCGATTHFAMKTADLPSGLRRGLDRLGIANLSKGHAEIDFVETEQKEEEPEINEYIPGGLYGIAPGSAKNATPQQNIETDAGFGAKRDPSKPPDPTLHYKARMPFADMRVDFGGKKAVISIFGLRSIYLDVPAFLDDFLNPYLDRLKEAVKGRGKVDAALEARALHEALELNLQRKGNIKEFRKLYPLGISNGVAENILRGTHLSIKRLTLRSRTIAATIGGAAGAGILAGCYFSSLPGRLLQIPGWGVPILDFAPPVITALLGWMVLNFAAYFDLHKHFPNAKKIGLIQATGKIGIALLVIILLVWLAALDLSPVRPLWMPPLVHK